MLLERLRKSPQWAEMAVIVTYDENGGFWDHVPPPSGPGWSDRWGPGTRIPTIIVSPFAKRGYVDKTPYDTTSIIKFITRRFGARAAAGRAREGGRPEQRLRLLIRGRGRLVDRVLVSTGRTSIDLILPFGGRHAGTPIAHGSRSPLVHP